jgi:hypothetical protein
MRKTTIAAAALAMSASLAGLAYAAAPDGRTAEDSSVVTSVSPASDSSASATEDVSGHGADDPISHDVNDDRGGRGLDVAGIPAVLAAVPAEQRHGADDGPGHDVGDDHGTADQGADDPAGHDAGDDHGSGGHGSDG